MPEVRPPLFHSIACALLATLLAPPVHGAGRTERPDVVWIFWDGTNLEGEAPRLQDLLSRSVRFPRTHVPVPLGRPHRTALLSGRWPRESGVCFRSGPQRGRIQETVLTPLREAGYRSYQYGTHFRRLPEGAGFDGQGTSPDALRAFLAESPETPLFACFTLEVPGGPRGGARDPAARRAFMDRELGAFLAALETREGRARFTFVIADPLLSPTEFDPDAVLERVRARTLAVVTPAGQARVVDGLFDSLSLHSTLAELAGFEPRKGFPGSLVETLVSGTQPAPQPVLGSLYDVRASGRGGASVAREVVAVYLRDRRYKYVLVLRDLGVEIGRDGETATIELDRGTELLFDLEHDPDEADDLSSSREQSGRLLDYRETLVAWWNGKARGELPVPHFSPPLGPPPKTDRPNIVLIISDDQDYEHLGFMGNTLVETPAIDTLAKEGVVFPVAHVTMSRCRPSLASLLTGRWPHQTEVYDNTSARRLGTEGSLPNLLKQAGYATFVGGKYWEGRTRAMGFMEPEKLDVRFRHFVRKSQNQLFDFIDRYGEERPFFVWWAPMLPHKPFDPPWRHQEPFVDVEIPVPEEIAEDDVEEFLRRERNALAMERWLDEGLAALVDKLKDAGEYDNTLFCFLIDNGWANGYASKGTVFEKGLRTPVYFTWPKGIEGGRTNDTLLSTVDVYATLLDYAGVPVPEGVPSRTLRAAIEEGEPSRETIYGVGYRFSGGRRKKNALVRDAFAIYARTPRYKYVYYLKDVQNAELFDFIHPCAPFPARKRGDVDFFDLEADPHERHDLSGDARYGAEIARLHAGWKAWWKEQKGPGLKLP